LDFPTRTRKLEEQSNRKNVSTADIIATTVVEISGPSWDMYTRAQTDIVIAIYSNM